MRYIDTQPYTRIVFSDGFKHPVINIFHHSYDFYSGGRLLQALIDLFKCAITLHPAEIRELYL